MNIYDDAKRADKPNLWILLLTELVIRLAENLADVGKSIAIFKNTAVL